MAASTAEAEEAGRRNRMFIEEIESAKRETRAVRERHKHKSTKHSDMARELGNKAFASKHLQQANKLYEDAVRHAEWPSAQLALALANRAAVALELDAAEACALNLRLALELAAGRPKLQDKLDKWRQRLIKAEALLKQQQPATDKKPAVVGRLQPYYKGTLAEVPTLSAATKVVVDPAKGRSVLAAVDIPAGALLIRERSMAWHILPQVSSRVCLGCTVQLTQATFTLPCTHCARPHVKFCSFECRDMVWQKFHRFELADMVETTEGTLMKAIIAQRLISMHPAPMLLQCDPALAHVVESVAVMGTKAEHKYRRDLSSVGTVMSLMSSERSEMRALDGAALLPYTSLSSPLLLGADYWPPALSIHERQAVVTRIFTALVQRIDVNLFGMCLVIDGEEHVEAGCKVSITSTLLNHACTPTVMSTIHGNSHEWRAKADIAAGTEITSMYCGTFGETRRVERQAFLKYRYGFDCVCEACGSDELAAMEDQVLSLYKCQHCKQQANEVDDAIICCSTKCGRPQPYDNAVVIQTIKQTIQALAQYHNQNKRRPVQIQAVEKLVEPLAVYLNERGRLMFQCWSEAARIAASTGHTTLACAIMQRQRTHAETAYKQRWQALLPEIVTGSLQVYYYDYLETKNKANRDEAARYARIYLLGVLGQHGLTEYSRTVVQQQFANDDPQLTAFLHSLLDIMAHQLCQLT